MLQKDCEEAGVDQGELGSNFSSLSREDSGLDRNGDQEVSIRGQTWKIFLRGVSKDHLCLDYSC